MASRIPGPGSFLSLIILKNKVQGDLCKRGRNCEGWEESTRQRLKTGLPSQGPGGECGSVGPWGLAQAKLRVVQLLASSFHCWEGWVVPLVPSQAGRSPVPSSGQDQDKTCE